MAVIGMAVILNLIGFMIGTARVVHDHDERSVNRSAYRSLIKLLRRVGSGLACRLSVLVVKGIGEGLYRLAHRHYQHVVDGSKHFCLALSHGIGLLPCLNHAAKFQSELAQFGRNQPRYGLCIVRTIGFGHHAHGHKAVFISQIGHATKGSSVVDGVLEEELYARIVNGFTGIVDDILQHEVGLFYLVVEEKIGL